jgi:hypothetical protein
MMKQELNKYKNFYLTYLQIVGTLSRLLQQSKVINKKQIFLTLSGKSQDQISLTLSAKLQLPEIINKRQIFQTVSGKSQGQIATTLSSQFQPPDFINKSLGGKN